MCYLATLRYRCNHCRLLQLHCDNDNNQLCPRNRSKMVLQYCSPAYCLECCDLEWEENADDRLANIDDSLSELARKAAAGTVSAEACSELRDGLARMDQQLEDEALRKIDYQKEAAEFALKVTKSHAMLEWSARYAPEKTGLYMAELYQVHEFAKSRGFGRSVRNKKAATGTSKANIAVAKTNLVERGKRESAGGGGDDGSVLFDNGQGHRRQMAVPLLVYLQVVPSRNNRGVSGRREQQLWRPERRTRQLTQRSNGRTVSGAHRLMPPPEEGVAQGRPHSKPLPLLQTTGAEEQR
ncbi:hypothetical protein QBC35DRAFT_159601 [Podospora australis]|uniref:Uncharacterized protein n=1 Tax=Podospora australis TaxID=1536484 RepID=A0AAN7API9_9PEZI|nr:hypothetical protein QBC35DRAFT_159601 [Podospora australis]